MTWPNDAGEMTFIACVPRPGEGEGVVNLPNGRFLAGVVNNPPTDITRSGKDQVAEREVETGTS
jgi:hypothetical protein